MSGNNRVTNMLRQGGFTLIELMITVAIAVILATVAVPSFSSYIDNQRVRTGAQDLYGAIQLARSEAIKRNADVTIQYAGSNWTDGWTVTVNGNTLRQHAGLDGLSLANSPNSSITFGADGRADSVETFEFCDKSQADHVTRRVVEIALSGRPRLERGATCS